MISTLTMIQNQASGRSSGNHGVFLRNKIEALTIEGVRIPSSKKFNLLRVGR